MQTVKDALLDSNGLQLTDLENTLSNLMSNKIDFSDLYMQESFQESFFLEDYILKSYSSNHNGGMGIRAIAGEKSSLAYTDDLSLSAIDKAAKAARSLALTGEPRRVAIADQVKYKSLYTTSNPLLSISLDEKIALMRKAEAILSLEKDLVNSQISLTASYSKILIVNSEGLLATDIRPLVRLDVSVVLEKNGKRGTGFAAGGARDIYGYYLEGNKVEHYTHEAIRKAKVNLEAKPAPAGNMTVVLGSGWPGVLLHEAVGHGLEADANRKGVSAFSKRMGEKVASSLCTVVDDGTLPGRRGSLNVDDEGVASQRNVLIEDGVLKKYMQDRLNAKLMGVSPTGNGRRESYQHLPLPRMTNTFMLPGKHTKEEIISSVKHGIYAPDFGGGQVDTTSGNFVFSAKEAYMIENGKITYPIKGATLIGNGPEVLHRVSMVGDDLSLDPGVGTCGKDGQSVVVGVGQPTLKVDGLTVGGTGK